MKPSRRRAAALAVAGAAIFLVAVVVATAGDSGTVVVEDRALHGSPALSGPFQVEGAGDVAVLQEPADRQLLPAPAEAPPESQSALALSLAGQGVTAAVPAHTVDRPLDEEITVAEVGADACVGIESLATCGGPEAIGEGHVVAVELCSPELGPGAYRVLGMVPDDVESVLIETRAGASTSAPVEENVFEAVASDVPEAIVWQGGEAEGLSVPAPVPPNYDPSSCQG